MSLQRNVIAFGYQNGTAEQVVTKAITAKPSKMVLTPPADTTITKKVTVTAAQNAYNLVIANSLTMKIVKVSTNKRKNVYYHTDTGRIFRKKTDRIVTFKVNDQVKIEKGFLAAQFLKNQNGTKVKIEEIIR